MVTDDRIDQRLREAGQRARSEQPDPAEAREAYQHRQPSADRRLQSRPTRPRRVWPALVGAGLVGAAVVGIVAFGTTGGSDTLTPPIDTADDPLPAPSVASVVDQSVTSTTTPIVASPCDRTRAPDGAGDVVVVNCRRGDAGEEAALFAQVAADDALSSATRWWVQYAPLSSDPVELFFPAPVDGIADTISFLRDFDSGLHCVVLVEQVVGGEWREACWLDTPVTQVVSNWSGNIVQFDLTNARATVAHVLDGISWASSGCRNTDLTALLSAADQAGALFDGVGCVVDTAVVHRPWTRMQPGPLEGSLRTLTRTNDGWTLDADDSAAEYAFAIPEYELWTSRTTNEPHPVTYDIASINTRPTSERADPALLVTLAVELIFRDVGIQPNQWISDVNGTFIEIPIINPDDHADTIAWHFLHVTGTPDTGYQIIAWYQADT